MVSSPRLLSFRVMNKLHAPPLGPDPSSDDGTLGDFYMITCMVTKMKRIFKGDGMKARQMGK
jgi:hypothetical protein|tara:strand:- start:468 stop:653 length:186 start_codon:yes stop_codon:yes gene_type:complete